MKYFMASSYYFLSNYQTLKHQRYAKSLIHSLDGTSFEIGHHISGRSINEKQLSVDFHQFRYLVRKLYGERVHMLRFEVNHLFSQLEQNGYCYDNSLLFPEELGYRTGFTYPHYIFDPIEKKQFNVVAIPLNVMDTTLFNGKFLTLSDREAEIEMMAFLDSIIEFGGAISILIHNTFFYLNTATRFIIYDRMLKFFSDRNIRVGTCRELFLWRKGL